jgi:hypothetical protein
MDEYHKLIEASYVIKRESKESSQRLMTRTGRETVLKFLYEHQENIWWWSWEFVGQHTREGDFLSHRAPARASDLALHEPDLVEDRRVGRFKMYRIRLENEDKIIERLCLKQ